MCYITLGVNYKKFINAALRVFFFFFTTVNFTLFSLLTAVNNLCIFPVLKSRGNTIPDCFLLLFEQLEIQK